MQALVMLLAAGSTCYLGLLATATAAANPGRPNALGSLPAHRRQKRDWIWNQMHIDEERNDSLPHYVGKIKSSVDRKNTEYQLRGDSAGKVFRVDKNTGDVYALERLDREKISEYHLTALVVDKDTKRNLESPSSFTIKVHDVNDNWPVFTHRVFNASVPEMSGIGTSVIQVTAVDADDPTVADHASVVYQLTKGKDSFDIRGPGLIVTMNKHLDRETQDKYEVVVEAEDAQGRRGESGTATVFITLQDVNDNFPIFTQCEPLSLGPGGGGALREKPGIHPPLPPPQSEPTSDGFPVLPVSAHTPKAAHLACQGALLGQQQITLSVVSHMPRVPLPDRTSFTQFP